MAQCPTCGGALAPNATRCVKCGAAIQPEPAQPSGYPQGAYQQPMYQQPVYQQPPVVMVQAPPQVMGQVPMRICQNCQVATPQHLVPIAKRGMNLSGSQWAAVIILCFFWLLPGLIALLVFSNKNRWVCPSCGHSNEFKG